jgi:hypothetical protein
MCNSHDQLCDWSHVIQQRPWEKERQSCVKLVLATESHYLPNIQLHSKTNPTLYYNSLNPGQDLGQKIHLVSSYG